MSFTPLIPCSRRAVRVVTYGARVRVGVVGQAGGMGSSRQGAGWRGGRVQGRMGGKEGGGVKESGRGQGRAMLRRLHLEAQCLEVLVDSQVHLLSPGALGRGDGEVVRTGEEDERS